MQQTFLPAVALLSILTPLPSLVLIKLLIIFMNFNENLQIFKSSNLQIFKSSNLQIFFCGE